MSWVIWITGLPGSGKSTISAGIQERFPDTVILNTDELRKIVTPSPDYSDAERDLVYRAIVYMAKTLYSLGHNVIIDATGNRRSWRELAREVIMDYFEVFLECPLELCVQRESHRKDTRGAPRHIYEKAGLGYPVPGISAPYEKPERAELVINTGEDLPETAVDRICRMLDDAHDE
jgi:adenylylsulfate kinase